MADVLVTYYSRSGHTREMAQLIGEAVRQEGLDVEVTDIKEVSVEDLLNFKGVIIGSPTYYGGAASEVRKLFDDTVKYHGKLDGKAGGAFTSAANIGGGNETAILSILHSLLIHGMIVQGMPIGDHYGPVAIGAPDDRCKKQCKEYGKRFAGLVKSLKR